MTVCNMSIEAGARAGMVAPDDTTYEYLADREFSPKGEAFNRAVERWSRLRTDEEASYDKSISIDAKTLAPPGHMGDQPRYGNRCDRRCPGSGRYADT